ncbi:subtilisin-like protein [Gymnopus androsaceus JB14]|uniref:Subtilisin-like protein n=1 Tax=Gymnopus androsaceus JB14 TaxID=1447944 RepID=A0A6A4ICS4_9AGAR|nr:subtilisin-like protein [Gymnopus androsaceus JB14]
MVSLLVLVLLSLTWSVSAVSSPARRAYDTHDYYVLELDSDHEHYSNLLGVEIVEQVGELDGCWLVRAEKREEEKEDAILARYHASKPNPIKSLTYQTLRQRVKRSPPTSSDVSTKLGILDPLFPDQWHLINPDSPEHMMNVTGLWEEGYTGLGVISSLIDDGLDYTSEDLSENFDAVHSHDYNDHEDLPTPKLSDDTHGTRCAGQIAAAKNGVCGLGIAYHSRVAGVRILSGAITDTDEAAALNFGYDEVSIYSCSWGPRDDGHTMEGPDYLITKAMVNGVNRGRQGKGSVFVFASGNGKGSGDECNYDGYTNSIWSVTVGAVDWTGSSPYYSEAAPQSWLSPIVPVMGRASLPQIKERTTAQRLTEELQLQLPTPWHLCVRTARPINYDPRSTISSTAPSSRSPDTAYELTSSQRPFSYAYGYGVLDAYTFVHAALTWELVPRQTWMRSRTVVLGDGKMTKENVISGGTPFGQGGQTTVSSTLEVTEKMMRRAHFAPHGLEHVNVKVWIEHQRRGDVHVEVISPNGVRSVLAGVSSGSSGHEGDEGGRKNDKASTGFPGWVFMSVKHWTRAPWEHGPSASPIL